MGIYKSLAEVPRRYRLYQYEAEFETRDVWGEWKDVYYDPEWGDETMRAKDRSERLWKDHMDERGRHHALAHPEDVEEWCAELLEDRAPKTVCDCYYMTIKKFYEWLLWEWEYPHRYNPVLMAAAEHGATKDAYDYNVLRRR